MADDPPGASRVAAGTRSAGDEVSRWIAETAHPLTTIDPDAPPLDLEPLADMVGDATVVGLARPTHGARELGLLTHRVVRFLVERLGFRSLALEEDWTTGLPIDEHLRTGRGDLRTFLGGASPPYRTCEMLDVLAWMRAYDERHPADPVRFVGLDISGVDARAYDAVAAYVRRTAPDRLGELEAHYVTLRPTAEHTGRDGADQEERSAVDHARSAHDLVRGLPAGAGHDLAVHHAQAVVDTHELEAIDATNSMNFVESRLARNVIWWHEHTGHKVVCWSGSHAAVGHERTVSFPPAPPKVGRNAGSYLREHFGERYVSGLLSFHHGSAPGPVPAPAPGRADAALGSTGLDGYMLDLRAAAPEAVSAWLDAPATLRLIGPSYDPGDDASHHMSGGSLGEWFDLVLHHRAVTAARPLA